MKRRISNRALAASAIAGVRIETALRENFRQSEGERKRLNEW